MDRNFFSTRDQILFITYEDVIKMNYAILLQTIIKDYKEELGSILKISEIENYDIHNLNRVCIERTYKNPLKYLCINKDDFELCDELLDTFEKEFTDMYAMADFTDFGAKLFNILMQPFVKKVYIHTDKRIYQIPYDCKLYFSDFEDKVEYVYGDMLEFIKSLDNKPTTYILNDIEKANELFKEGLLEYTELLLAELGYNFKLTDNKDDIVLKYGLDKHMKDGKFKLGFLSVINLEEKHFSCLRVIDDISRDGDKI